MQRAKYSISAAILVALGERARLLAVLAIDVQGHLGGVLVGVIEGEHALGADDLIVRAVVAPKLQVNCATRSTGNRSVTANASSTAANRGSRPASFIANTSIARCGTGSARR